tara:strand:+ start:206 stop:343 length:138 start_codon:yes stop_codon:yes gene_type:complete
MTIGESTFPSGGVIRSDYALITAITGASTVPFVSVSNAGAIAASL